MVGGVEGMGHRVVFGCDREGKLVGRRKDESGFLEVFLFVVYKGLVVLVKSAVEFYQRQAHRLDEVLLVRNGSLL